MNRRRFLLGVLVAGGMSVCGCLLFSHFGLDVKQSGEGFRLGGLVVMVTYGYSDDGDRLRYMVIRPFLSTSTAEERFADPRFDNSGILPRIQYPDGARPLAWRACGRTSSSSASRARTEARREKVAASKYGDKSQGTVTITIDPTTKPKWYDMTIPEGPKKGQVLQGIYELEGDTWKYCQDKAGKGRPTEFSGKAGSGWVLVIMKKEKLESDKK
jgi:uncharacterized protein (TIGR03067 family)